MPLASRLRTCTLALLLALTAAPAPGGEREFRDKRKAYDAALEAALADKGREPSETERLVGEFRKALGEMFGADERQAAEYVLKPGLARPRALAREQLAFLGGIKDERAVRDLVKAIEDAKDAEQLHLLSLLGRLPGDPPLDVAVKLLRARDDRVVRGAAEALQARGKEAAARGEGPLQRLLRSSSRSVRYAGARALEALTGTRPDGYPEPAAGPDGLPDRWACERVAFLLDATRAAGEKAFADPFAPTGEEAPGGDKKPGGGKKPEEPAAAAAVSVWQVAAARLAEHLRALGEEAPQVHVARYGASVRAWQDGYARADRRGIDGLTGWLDRDAEERGRDVLAALEHALRLSPPPDEVVLFVAGLPEGRGTTPEKVIEGLQDLLWETGARVHVIGFRLSPEKDPSDARGREALALAQTRFDSFVEQLARASDARQQVHLVARSSGPPAEAPAAPGAQLDLPKTDLTKPVPRGEREAVRSAVKRLVDQPELAAPARDFLEAVCACPDTWAAEPIREALRGGYAAAEAAVSGLSKNPDASLLRELGSDLRGERDATRQLDLVRALGANPAPEAIALVLEAMEGLNRDARRLAWQALSQRPAEALAPHLDALRRGARDQVGAASFYASVALALAAGNPPPQVAGLRAGPTQLLPERYLGGVAFVVDLQRDVEGMFIPAAQPDPNPSPAASPDKGPQRGGPKTPDKPAAPPPGPVSRLEAIRHELNRALDALGQSELHANILPTIGKAWQKLSRAMAKKEVENARGWLNGVRTGAVRDVAASLEEALRDPEVEAIHVLVCGAPVRAPGERSPADFITPIRTANRSRRVPITFVYVLGPEPTGAAREDLLRAMEDVYRPVAEASGGEVLERNEIPRP